MSLHHSYLEISLFHILPLFSSFSLLHPSPIVIKLNTLSYDMQTQKSRGFQLNSVCHNFSFCSLSFVILCYSLFPSFLALSCIFLFILVSFISLLSFVSDSFLLKASAILQNSEFWSGFSVRFIIAFISLSVLPSLSFPYTLLWASSLGN